MTVRQYIDSTAIESITGVAVVDEKLINAAESSLDCLANDLMDQMYTNNLPSFLGDLEFSQTEAVFGENKLTLPAQGYITNYFQFTVVELLQDSGTFKKGTKFPVRSSFGNILSFETTSKVVTGINTPVKIYQVGVFPRRVDQGNYGKTIPHQVIEAVAWQVAHLQSQGCDVASSVANADQKGKVKSETIGTTYSYTLADATSSSSSICEKSKNLLATIL
jgi:hypothetical protein